MRRRRNEISVELRKNKRNETLLKRRNVPYTAILDDDDEDDRFIGHTSLEMIISNASRNEPELQLAAVQGAR